MFTGENDKEDFAKHQASKKIVRKENGDHNEDHKQKVDENFKKTRNLSRRFER